MSAQNGRKTVMYHVQSLHFSTRSLLAHAHACNNKKTLGCTDDPFTNFQVYTSKTSLLTND